MARVLIKKLNPDVELPVYKTSGASGMDLMAFIDETFHYTEAQRKILIDDLNQEEK